MSVLDKIKTGETFDIKCKAGSFYKTLTIQPKAGKLRLWFDYNVTLLKDVKEMFEGRRWLGVSETAPKCWEIPVTQRNIFRLQALMGKYADYDPYQQYDLLKIKDFKERIKEHAAERRITPYNHQIDLINVGLIVRHFIWAADMGVGKTLSAIILMEMSGLKDWLWVAPRSALTAARLEFDEWRTTMSPVFVTYEGMRDLIQNWPANKAAPQGVIFDEASKLKTPTAKRTIAARYLADNIRLEHGYNSVVGLLSGTPAPKSPADWFSLCEIACPGYIREGNLRAFTERLALIENRETVPGAGSYAHIVTWKDSDSKCAKCGQLLEVHRNNDHPYEPMQNEVAKLKTRLSGLVTVKIKSECVDLPEKRFKVITVKPSRSTLNAARLIAQTSKRTIEALTRLRELSDGFQYVEKRTGRYNACGACDAQGVVQEHYCEGVRLTPEELSEGKRWIWSQPADEYEEPQIIDKVDITTMETKDCTCYVCKGTREIEIIERDIAEVPCPKDQVLIDLLEQHEECGRLNTYAGFTGSIERILKIHFNQKWAVIRADGRGWQGYDPSGNEIGGSAEDLMRLYKNGHDMYPYIGFVGQPGAAGMGLTLTASPTTFFFSNDFNGENRMQAEDRGHRLSMDRERGGLIVDVVHLESDLHVLENIRKKKDLQTLSMRGFLPKLLTGDLSDAD